MKAKEVQTVKKQLQQLDAELRRFKEELLTARVEELEQAIHRPAGWSRSGMRGMLAASICQSK